MGGRQQHRRERRGLGNVTAPAATQGSAGKPVTSTEGTVDSLANYESAISDLKAALPSPSNEQVVAVLVARDRIEQLLNSGAELSAREIQRLAELDGAVREAAIEIDSALGKGTLSVWKQSMDPGSKRWWWSLDEVAASARVKLHPGWALVATGLLGISFAITGLTIAQLLKVAAVSAGVTAFLVQAALTFLTGSALTERGRKSVLRVLASVGVRAKFRDLKVVAMAVAVLALSSLALWQVPGRAADLFARRGDALASHEAWSQAIDNYNLAIALKPTDPNLHFKIGLAYDKSEQFDRAIDEYKEVVAADDKNASALNNLARLYLIQKKEPYAALRLLDRLDQGFENLPTDGRYSVLKNRGWAKVELSLFAEAEGDLAAALRINRDGIAARYLLGRVLEELKRPIDAQREFTAVIKTLKDNPEAESELEPDWILYAQRQLLQGGTN